MVRIAGVQKAATLFTRIIFSATKKRIGRVVQPQRIAALAPPILYAHAAMEMAQEKSKAIPAALVRLGQVRVAMRVGCPF